VQDLRKSEEVAAELSARLEDSQSAAQTRQDDIRQLEQRLEDVRANSVRELEGAGKAASDEASRLRERAAEELASAQ
jgi:hypothetical protein